MNVTVVGLGLIGGSIAFDLQKINWITKVTGVENNKVNAKVAKRLGIVNKVKPLKSALKNADLVILSVPVNTLLNLLPEVLNSIKKETIVVDMGSTKVDLLDVVNSNKNRGRYVSAHPMAGTEYSGPQAAVKQLFKDKICIICDIENSDKDAAIISQKLFTDIGMRLKFMSAKQHDLHAAYVSHISHISSFVLAETVLDKEKDEQAIFDMAAGGFSSTVRLAKSSPEMWMPIFIQNSENLTEVLNTYIENITKFRNAIESKDEETLLKIMRKSNQINKIIE